MLYFETVCSLMQDISTILRLRISVNSPSVHQAFIHTTLDFLLLVTLCVNKSRLSIRINSLSIFGAKLWNCLKPDLRKLRKIPFKKQFLFAVGGDKDD